ncbi:hypothetical protein FHR81_002182 [Actinoalloteichus hoggarensis]|uniref:Uncharacterized protein n=1 Tax=Actinoalloteichus hoggarensis TaxID=1470176 RepID=A0A221W689_9PSEU|nr:hypothetical protein [Actinoalloteichus hoggarensis]ASO21214.1 hypothetical protein AHOG_17945 [Actinoalloteichus hoggarensis]MBB5921144.1 hypothetical protein [Actinoalloteichus hoggarensis]
MNPVGATDTRSNRPRLTAARRRTLLATHAGGVGSTNRFRFSRTRRSSPWWRHERGSRLESGSRIAGLAPRGRPWSNDLVDAGCPSLPSADITDRFTCAYRGCYVDVVRELDVVAALLHLAALPHLDAARVGG